jgi:hypothetical protein
MIGALATRSEYISASTRKQHFAWMVRVCAIATEEARASVLNNRGAKRERGACGDAPNTSVLCSTEQVWCGSEWESSV